jgi:hypothetical protein
VQTQGSRRCQRCWGLDETRDQQKERAQQTDSHQVLETQREHKKVRKDKPDATKSDEKQNESARDRNKQPEAGSVLQRVPRMAATSELEQVMQKVFDKLTEHDLLCLLLFVVQFVLDPSIWHEFLIAKHSSSL